MDEEFKNRLFNKLDKINDDIVDIKVTQASQHEVLKEHIRRTEAAEENIDMLREEFKPAQRHVESIQWACKIFLQFIAPFTAIVTIVAKFFHLF